MGAEDPTIPITAGGSAPGQPDPALSDPGWAWARYESNARRPWTLAQAGHLLRRAAFGAGWTELRRTLDEGPQRTIDRLLKPGAEAEPALRTLDADEAASGDSDSTEGIRAWWLRRMVCTPHPLLERMTFFWHGFFGISNVRVKGAARMRRHVQILRRHALGSFEDLLQELRVDPALLLGLDGAANRKARPSEFLPRMLLAQYTVGEGNFTESDVCDTARAFTGWFVLRGETRYIPREHDGGPKRILGREGDFGSEDALRIAARESATARRIARSLYGLFISEIDDPPEALLKPLAEAFAGDRDIGRLVETILRSNLFFSEAAWHRRMKGPVDFALGLVKALEAEVPSGELGKDLAALGQEPYAPPTVQGWPAGADWIHWQSFAARSNLAAALLSTGDPYGGRLDPQAVAQRHGKEDPAGAVGFLIDLLLQGELDAQVRRSLLEDLPRQGEATAGEAARRLRRITHRIAALPEFHLA